MPVTSRKRPSKAVASGARAAPARARRKPLQVDLALQGGGALGAYQAGAYEALDESNIRPDWVAGISIGAINAAIIAGNPPENRVAQLREFWMTVTANPICSGITSYTRCFANGITARRAVNQASAQTAMIAGVPGFFTPRALPPFFSSRAGPQESTGL